MRKLTDAEGEKLFELLLAISRSATKVKPLGCPYVKEFKESIGKAQEYLANDLRDILQEKRSDIDGTGANKHE